MIPDDIDPSLCTGEPKLERLDDGFSPPAHEPPPAQPEATVPAQGELAAKSPF